MYDLFELKKILTLVKPGGDSGAAIELSTYSEYAGRSILALVCDNGYLLFYYLSKSVAKPVIRQLNWLSGPGKSIKALSFDPSSTWLLLVTLDASVYILPVLPLLDSSINFPHHWKADNVTEIKLTGQRAPLTSVRWWQTLQGQHIAVIGSELGEIAFVNLMNKKEVGGTYITVGISALDILKDESHDTTYLLITGYNRQQWRLLLEEKRTNCYWPFNSEVEVISCDDGKGVSILEKNTAEKDEKDGDQKPHKLSKFESGTFLTPQSSVKRNLVSAYNASSNMLQVLEGDLDQMHLFSYQVPADCENVILSDKLIFITQTYRLNNGKFQSCLRLMSRKFSEICLENSKRKEHQNSEVQTFHLNDKIIAIYKRSFDCGKTVSLQNSSVSSFISQTTKDHLTTEPLSSTSHANTSGSENASLSSSGTNCESDSEQEDNNITQKYLGIESFFDVSSLDGCYLVSKDTIWECRLRVPPEILFLTLTSIPSDLLLAEKLGIMLGLEIHKLYEVAAEVQLSRGQFALAVHLYQLSKCPQLKRIAHFMSYGYLSELIAYIQVLFSTKSVEIVAADKCHFANIALHCFAQQAMEKVNEQKAISSAFKKFLRDNVYYDEAVTIKLFAEQGLFDLLYYFSKVRGQHGLLVDTLLNTEGLLDALDSDDFEAMSASGFNTLTSHLNYEDYLLCITSPKLLQYLVASPKLLSQHMQQLIKLLPNMNTCQLTKVATLFDLSHPFARLAIRNISSSKHRQRYWSTGSITPTLKVALKQMENLDSELTNEEDFIKFFIFVLLMLCHSWKKNSFDLNLLPSDSSEKSKELKESSHTTSSPACLPPTRFMPLACGMAHVAYYHNNTLLTWGKAANGRLGNGDDISVEFENPSVVNLFVNLQVKVISVSCGASHTMALTDCGVFSWGSSRYGQLGLGDIQRSAYPVVIEGLLNKNIVSILCGQYHSLALTECGRVYSWGWGVHGQLGHGNPEDLNVPKMIDHLKMKKFISLAAGQGHSVLLTNNGEIYTFGCGMFGQLGTGSILKHSFPQFVPFSEKVILVCSGYFHTVAVTEANNIYTWGCNPQALRLQAQCSRRARQANSSQNQASPLHTVSSDSGSTPSRTGQSNSHSQTHLSPTLVDCSSINSPIIHVSCGSHHTALLTSSGELYTWGRNMEGQIGNGSRREQKVPTIVTELNAQKIVFVACGADFTIAVDSASKLFGWGKNDYGQVGQKVPEAAAKASTGSSSGRVITIRTNRRMITITQPCRQSLLHPVEITLPRNENLDFDSSSFDSEYTTPAPLQHRTTCDDDIQKLHNLSSYDDPPYGPYALHATLKVFHFFYDATSVLKHCLSFSNYQAAAKICFLQKNYADAVNYHFMAMTADTMLKDKEFLPLALYIVEFFSSYIDIGNLENNKMFLYNVIKFWTDKGLSVQPLEALLQKYFHTYSYPLCLLLFRNPSGETGNELDVFLSHISKNFCVNLVTSVLNKVCDGVDDFDMIENILKFSNTESSFRRIYGSDALTSWNDSVPLERLWHEITRNIQKGIINYCFLSLSGNDVDALAKSLLTEKLYYHQERMISCEEYEKVIDSSNMDTIAFSCNHHYTLQVFNATVLPSFKDSLLRLPCVLPSTVKYLMNCYHSEELIPIACPKCVLNEIRGEF